MRSGSNHIFRQLAFGFVLAVAFFGASVPVNAAHTIAGIVFDANRTPLPDIDVELLDQFYRMVARQKTAGGGRFEFNVGTASRYTVKVYAFRYDFEDQSQEVLVSAVSAVSGEAGSSYTNVDFYLQPRRGSLMEAELGVVFAQDIPTEAKRAYEGALKDFSTKRNADGFKGLNRAIELKPDYYLALNKMGRELFVQARYEEAIPFLLKASELNHKSPTTFYYLGASLFHLGKDFHKAAAAALGRAVILAPSAPQIHFVLGRVQRSEKRFTEAEVSLVKAKRLASSNIPDIHKELAQLYGDDLKKYAEAANELEAYMKSSSQKGADQEKTKQVIVNLRAKARSNPSD